MSTSATHGDNDQRQTHMASETRAIQQVVQAAKKDANETLKQKAQKAYVRSLEIKKRAAEKDVRYLKRAPNMTQLLVSSGTAVAGGSTLRASTNGSLQLSATGGGADA